MNPIPVGGKEGAVKIVHSSFLFIENVTIYNKYVK